MSKTKGAVLCGSCKCEVKAVANPKPHDKVICPRCGRSDRFDKVMVTLQEYAAHLAQKHIAEGFASAARRNSRVKFKPQNVSNRSFRWIADVRV